MAGVGHFGKKFKWQEKGSLSHRILVQSLPLRPLIVPLTRLEPLASLLFGGTFSLSELPLLFILAHFFLFGLNIFAGDWAGRKGSNIGDDFP